MSKYTQSCGVNRTEKKIIIQRWKIEPWLVPWQQHYPGCFSMSRIPFLVGPHLGSEARLLRLDSSSWLYTELPVFWLSWLSVSMSIDLSLVSMLWFFSVCAVCTCLSTWSKWVQEDVQNTDYIYAMLHPWSMLQWMYMSITMWTIHHYRMSEKTLN